MITAKEKRFLKYWEDQKTGGKWQYILVYTIGWSFIIFVLPLAGSFVIDMYTAFKLYQLPVWAAILVSIVLALALSFYIWHRNETKYRGILDRERAQLQ